MRRLRPTRAGRWRHAPRPAHRGLLLPALRRRQPRRHGLSRPRRAGAGAGASAGDVRPLAVGVAAAGDPDGPRHAGAIPMSDLTTPRGVLALMESSRSLDEWNRNCARVADANAGRPEAARKSIGRV